MTAKFDMKASEEVLSYLKMCPSRLTWLEKPIEMTVTECSVKEARWYIASFHYSKSMPDSTFKVFKWMYWDELAGFAVYWTWCGMNQYRSISPDIKNWQYAELTRLWLFDEAPRNSESRLISESLKKLPKEIKLVLSYSDTRQNHQGTIYKATNWIISGITNWGKIIVDENWKEFHSRLIEMYRRRHPETYWKMNKIDIMESLKWKEIIAWKKYRFIQLINISNKKKRKLIDNLKKWLTINL